MPKDTDQPMKIVGERDSHLYWEQFNRLQRRTNQLLANARCPKGVYCFKSYEEFENWKGTYRLKKRATSEKNAPAPLRRLIADKENRKPMTLGRAR